MTHFLLKTHSSWRQAAVAATIISFAPSATDKSADFKRPRGEAMVAFPAAYAALVPEIISAEQACIMGRIGDVFNLQFERELTLQAEKNREIIFKDKQDSAAILLTWGDRRGVTFYTSRYSLMFNPFLRYAHHTAMTLKDENQQLQRDKVSQIMDGEARKDSLPPSEEHMALHYLTYSCNANLKVEVPADYLSLVPKSISVEQACILGVVNKKYGYRFVPVVKDEFGAQGFVDTAAKMRAHAFANGFTLLVRPIEAGPSITVNATRMKGEHGTGLLPDVIRTPKLSAIFMNGWPVKPRPNSKNTTNMPTEREGLRFHIDTLKCRGTELAPGKR